LAQFAADLRLHFHELVHVAQGGHLGAIAFMERYITEIQSSGYHEAPLEKRAYDLDAHLTSGGEEGEVRIYVGQRV
ncbi:hypothetical protein Q4519_22185, partial [Motilimonas sp. 1_MG-2023]|uniref:hypothetical protein n=1 Tax=Motilimonas sp. 1_MG-2023 TaxID=3062672 RepID=UPI0026E33A5C